MKVKYTSFPPISYMPNFGAGGTTYVPVTQDGHAERHGSASPGMVPIGPKARNKAAAKAKRKKENGITVTDVIKGAAVVTGAGLIGIGAVAAYNEFR